jgi:hypothetical protein
MADVVNPQVVDSVTVDNVKAIAGAGAEAEAVINKVLSSQIGILIGDTVASAGRRSNIADAAMAQVLNTMSSVDPEQAISVAKELSAGTDLPSILAQLGSALGALQQFSKVAQTTPPPTTAATTSNTQG